MFGSPTGDSHPIYIVPMPGTHNQPAAFTAAANTGANLSPEILSGRLVTINRGSVWPGVEALRFHLRENATVTVQ